MGGSSRRVVTGPIAFIRELPDRPPFIPQSRARGAKREGFRYERAFARAVGPRARHGIWLEWRDAIGRGWCQTDVILEACGAMFVFECKYTWTPLADAALRQKYIPLVSTLSGRPTYGIVVCRRLTNDTDGHVVSSLQSAMEYTTRGSDIPILHWNPDVPVLIRVPESIPRADQGHDPSGRVELHMH